MVFFCSFCGGVYAEETKRLIYIDNHQYKICETCYRSNYVLMMAIEKRHPDILSTVDKEEQ